jgi:hypothetical protein
MSDFALVLSGLPSTPGVRDDPGLGGILTRTGLRPRLDAIQYLSSYDLSGVGYGDKFPSGGVHDG